MAITTLDGLIAGLSEEASFMKLTGTMEAVGQLHSCWYAVGMPGAGAAPASGINGQVVDNTFVGALPYTNAASDQKYLAAFRVNGSLVGSVRLLDRLWQNSGLAVTTTTAQTITPVAIPSRDSLGAANGNGVSLYIEVVTATTNAGAITNMTASYTNSAGVAGRTATMSSFPATAALGTLCRFNLASGDTGVRSVQSVTLGTSLGAGSVSIVLAREILSVGCSIPNVDVMRDFASLGLPKLYNGTALMMAFLPNAVTSTQIIGGLKYAEG